MRWTLVVAMLLTAGAVQAQTPLTGTTGAPLASPAVVGPTPAAAKPAAPPRRGRTLQERFDEANTTHDGHLTPEQARAKMPAVARDFTEIDKDHKGYVTVDDIRAHAAAQRAARRAERAAAKPQ
jgi:hypothetical protein